MFSFCHLSPAFESTTLNTQWFMTGTRSLGRDVYNHPQRAITARVTAPQVLFFCSFTRLCYNIVAKFHLLIYNWLLIHFDHFCTCLLQFFPPWCFYAPLFSLCLFHISFCCWCYICTKTGASWLFGPWLCVPVVLLMHWGKGQEALGG